FDRTCWWRERCLEPLQRSGLDHRIVCTSENVAGIRAASAAGIAVGVLPVSALTSHFRLLPDDPLPPLGATHLVLCRARDAPAPLADILSGVIARTVQAMGRT